METQTLQSKKEELERKFIGAIQDGNLKTVKYCISLGEKRHITDYLPFQYSAASGHLEVLKYLVQQGASVHLNPKDKNACWGMVYAANNGKSDVVKFFVENLKDFKDIFKHPELTPNGKDLYLFHLKPVIAKQEKNKLKQGIKNNFPKDKKIKIL